MITPQRDPNSLVRTKTLSEIAGQDYSTTDYGVVEGLKATSLATIQRNFVVTAADWVKQYDERRDVKMGKRAPVTQEHYDKSPAAKYGLEFRANENPLTFERRIQKAAKLKYYNEIAQGQDRQLSQFVTSLGVGLTTDPTNLIGFGTGAGVAKASLYAAAGRRAAAAYHSGKGTFKNVVAYGAAFEVPYAFMSNDLGVEKYTFDQLKMSLGMNAAFAGVLSGVSAGASYRSAAKVAKAKSDYEVYNRIMTGDYTIPDALDSVYNSGNKAVVDVIKQDKRLTDIAEGRIKQDDVTLQDTLQIAALLKGYETHLKVSSMTAKLADDFLSKLQSGETSIFKARKEYEAKVGRVVDAVLYGKTQQLTKEDVSFLNSNNVEIRRQGDEAEPTKGGNQMHASYTVTENYGVVTKSEATANQALLDASVNARNLELEYFTLIEQGKRAEAMDMKPKLDEAKQVVDNLFGETYARMVEDINGMVNEVLLGDKKIVPVTIQKQQETKGAKGWKYPDELRNYIAEPHFLFADSAYYEGITKIPATEILYVETMSTLFHETWHNVKEINISAYNQLLDAASTPAIKKIMADILKKRGYYDRRTLEDDKLSIIEEESPSFLLEFALTRPEFWKVLQDDNPSLFNKYKNLVSKVLSHGAAVLKVQGSKRLLKMRNADKVAKEVGDIVKSLRDQVDSTRRMRQLYSQSASGRKYGVKPLTKAAYENPNFKSRADEMRKYSADPVAYLEDTIEATVGSEEVLPMLMPSALPETRAALSEYVAEVIKKLDEMGMGHVTPYVKDILINQMGTQKRRNAIVRAVRKAELNDEQIVSVLASLKEKGTPLDTAQRIGFILRDENISTAEKLGKINQYFHQENLAMVLRNIHDAAVTNKLTDIVKSKATPAEKLAQLKTVLDGSLRKGVERNTSIQRLVDGQIIKDQSPLIEYLVNNDLLEVFLGEDPTSYMSSYREIVAKNPEVARIYGENLKEGSLQLHLDLMDAISSGEIPKKWKGVDEFEGLVDIIKTINEGQMAEINHLGVNMRQRSGFTGYSMKYDKQVVSAMSEQEFVTFMLRVVDVEQTEKLHGGLMENKSESGMTFDRFEIDSFLRRFYNEIVSGKIDEDTAGAKSIVGSMRKAAKIAFKPEHRNDAMVTLSNFDNLGRLLLEQIRSRSEKIALVKNLGHDPYSMIMGVARKEGLDRVKGFSILDATAKQVTGMLDNPVDVNIAQNFQKVRQFSNVVFLAGSGMSALSDIPLMLTTMQYLGGDVTFKDFVASYRQAAKAHFKGNDKEMAAWFRSQGAGFDIITRQTAQRVVTGESYAGGLLGMANQLMFELNGLNRVTATHQQVFMDIMTNSLGEQFRSGNLNPVLEARMREFGFTDKELKALANYVEQTPDGKYRLGSSSIKNAALQRKVSGFLTTYMKEAVIEPDAGAMAITRLGLEAGTISGETARIALQYSSFMLGMSRVVYRRFLHGYSGEGKHNAHKMAHLITYVGAALGFAYMTTVMKDLAKFKEPIDPLDMTFFDFTRILRQSGVLGITELGLNAAQFGPSSTLSPVAGMAADVLSGDVSKGLKPLTGQQYPIIGPVIQKAIGFVMAETVQNAQNDLVRGNQAALSNTED